MSLKFRSLSLLMCAVVVASGFTFAAAPSQPASANGDGIMKWDTITTPNSDPARNDVLNPYIGGYFTGSEIRDLSIGSDGTTLIAAVTVDARYINPAAAVGSLGILLYTNSGGISWSTSAYLHLIASKGWNIANQVYNVLIAPGDPRIWAVTAGTVTNGPTEFWVTKDGGATWNSAQSPQLAAGEAISAIDISLDYGTGRDLMLVTRFGLGSGVGRIFMTNMAGFSAWMQQANPVAGNVDFFSAKFSPTYNGDQAYVLIMASAAGTFYNIGLRDLNYNTTPAWVYPGAGVEVKSSSSVPSLTNAQSRIASPRPRRLAATAPEQYLRRSGWKTWRPPQDAQPLVRSAASTVRTDGYAAWRDLRRKRRTPLKWHLP